MKAWFVNANVPEVVFSQSVAATVIQFILVFMLLATERQISWFPLPSEVGAVLKQGLYAVEATACGLPASYIIICPFPGSDHAMAHLWQGQHTLPLNLFAIMALRPVETPFERTVKAYLVKNDETFKELHRIREEGWNDPAGDVHYTNHHSKIDNARPEDKWKMYDDMAEIAREINNATSALTIPSRTEDVPVVLDLCMAPGGFTRTALELNPTAHVFGLTLPVNLGGQYLLIPPSPNITVRERDINLLAAEMGVSPEDIPPTHPEKARFDYSRNAENGKADLVFCDGNNERTHEKLRAEYRNKEMETRRLNLAQLVFALSRMREGGTLVMLLHTPENMLQILYSISKFADIQLYKPTCHHAPKSSAYLVAKNVRPTCPEALRAVEWWKGVWRRITFDTTGGAGDGEGAGYVAMSEDTVDEVLEKFGERFIELARPAWILQAEALAYKNKTIRDRKAQRENLKLEAPKNDKENQMRDAPKDTGRNSKQEAIEGPDWRRHAKPPETVEVPVWKKVKNWRSENPYQ